MIDFWSPMQSKIEGELCIIHGKANGSSFTWRIQALELCSPLLKPNQESKEEKQREESNMKKVKRRAAARHISSTSWSPFYTYYISFQILGSQKSNALNSVQIEAKMKKLWPLEDDYTMLKDNFASCEITNSTCEMDTFNLRNFHKSCFNLWNPPVYSQIFVTDSFRFFSSDICCLNPHFLLVIH